MTDMIMRVKGRALMGLLLAAAVTAGCSSSSDAQGTTSGTQPINVVAAENFYGDIARQIGGSHVAVTSILSDPDADPHLYEPGTANGAAVAAAQLVIDNGVGYDSFMGKLLDASPDPNRKVVTMADVLHITASDANPHLWYDLPDVPQIAGAIADGLGAVDPANRSYYEAQASSFDASLKPLDDAVAQIKATDAGAPVAYTEPVPGYLLQAAGLTVETPEAFALAIEEGNEPSPQAVADMNSLLTEKKIKVLLYNSQATSPITEHLLQLADQNGVPVVPLTETLPPGKTFQEWQLGQIRALTTALDG